MRKSTLWWAAAIIGILGAVPEMLIIFSGARKHLESGDWFIILGTILLVIAAVAIGWKRPLISGLVFIAGVLLLWGWAAVEVLVIGSRTGRYEPSALFSSAILRLPLLIAGILFLLSWRSRRGMVTG